MRSIRRRDRERSILEPPAVGIVNLHDLRLGGRGFASLEHAGRLSRDGIGQSRVGEGEDLFGIDVAQTLESCTIRLAEAMIEETPARSVDIGHHTIEDLPSILVLVEAQIEKRSMEPA